MRENETKTLDANLLEVAVMATLGGHNLSDWEPYNDAFTYSAYCVDCEGTVVVSTKFKLPLLTPICGVDMWEFA